MDTQQPSLFTSVGFLKKPSEVVDGLRAGGQVACRLAAALPTLLSVCGSESAFLPGRLSAAKEEVCPLSS